MTIRQIMELNKNVNTIVNVKFDNNEDVEFNAKNIPYIIDEILDKVVDNWYVSKNSKIVFCCKWECEDKEFDNDYWINVNDRLPNEDGWYNTTLKSDTIIQTGMSKFENGKWVHYDSEIEVVAWRFLPPPFTHEN